LDASVKSRPACREAAPASPTSSKNDVPLEPMFVHTRRRRYSTLNCMNIDSPASPVPGIEPRIPIVA